MARVNTRLADEKKAAVEALMSTGPENPDDYIDDIEEMIEEHGLTVVEIFELLSSTFDVCVHVLHVPTRLYLSKDGGPARCLTYTYR